MQRYKQLAPVTARQVDITQVTSAVSPLYGFQFSVLHFSFCIQCGRDAATTFKWTIAFTRVMSCGSLNAIMAQVK